MGRLGYPEHCTHSLCLFSPQIYQCKKSAHLCEAPIPPVGFSLFITKPLDFWSLSWNTPWPFRANRRDTDHVRWVIWNRFRHKLISSQQRNAKSLPIPSTKLHHVCEINPRDTRGCQTAQRTRTLLSQTQQAALPADFPLKGAAISPLPLGMAGSWWQGWQKRDFFYGLGLWWAGKMHNCEHCVKVCQVLRYQWNEWATNNKQFINNKNQSKKESSFLLLGEASTSSCFTQQIYRGDKGISERSEVNFLLWPLIKERLRERCPGLRNESYRPKRNTSHGSRRNIL